MDATTFLVSRAIQRVESDCQGNIRRLAQAQTFADVVRLVDVHVPHEVRAIRNTIPGYKRLNLLAGDRVRALVDQRLAAIAAAASPEEALALRGRLMTDCRVLGGHFSREYHFADVESRRRAYVLQRAAETSPKDAP